MVELAVGVEAGFERREPELVGGGAQVRRAQIAQLTDDALLLLVGRQRQSPGQEALEIDLPVLDPLGELLEPGKRRRTRFLRGVLRFEGFPALRGGVEARPFGNQSSDLLEST
jgi:hypothetical protein